MARVWLISAHLLITLALPCAADAQAGLALASPEPSRAEDVRALGRDLGSPIAADASEIAGGDWPSSMPEGWALDVSALTSLPLSVGIDAQLQTPIGVFANLSVGHTPSAYLDMVAGVLAGSGVYGDEVHPLISEATRSGGWNVRFGLGVNPIEGLELSVGYTFLGASSSLSADAIEAATGQRVRYPGMADVPLSIEMHALYGRVAYRFEVGEHVVIRAALGWTHAIAASVRVDVPDAVRARRDNPASEIEQAVSEGFGDYGFTPELLLSAGYRF